jgi:hypothetical protein
MSRKWGFQAEKAKKILQESKTVVSLHRQKEIKLTPTSIS